MRIIRDEQGQAAALMVLLTGLGLVCFFAIAIDVGNLYRQRRPVQTAADAGALAAAAGESVGLDINVSAQTAASTR